MTSQVGAGNALGAVYQSTGLLLLQPCQAWEKDRTRDKGEVLDCDPTSRIQLWTVGLHPSRTWLGRGDSFLTPHIPAASGEGVTMGTNTKD